MQRFLRWRHREIFYLLVLMAIAALRPVLTPSVSVPRTSSCRPLYNNSCASAFRELLPGLTVLIFCSWLIKFRDAGVRHGRPASPLSSPADNL
ncbi:hypothetical protein KCP74_06855 [Salmonella enterica subsp. enterica]|nr:hypothetical protein KCP74_06855 [Salmonella enterica subsp. enterica]